MIVSARVVNTYIRPSPIRRALVVADVVREREAHADALADPVGLHRLHALGPAGHLVEVREQLLGVVGDLQVVHRDFALLDRRAGAPADAVDDLLVGEHRLVDRIPVDHAGLAGTRCPFRASSGRTTGSTGSTTGSQVANSRDQSIAQPIALHCPFMQRDVVARPLRRGDAGSSSPRFPPAGRTRPSPSASAG